MTNVTVIGLDIAKNHIQIHGMDKTGKPGLKAKVARADFLETFSNYPRCLVGMESCSGANYWGKQLRDMGFEVRLMSPIKVKPYVDNQKNDARDAAACAEAVTRGQMRFVPIKSKAQMEIQFLHRVRSHYVKEKTGLMNMARGLLLELGIAIRQGDSYLLKKLTELLSDESERLSGSDTFVFEELLSAIKAMDEKIKKHTLKLELLAKTDSLCQRISRLPGIGPITATAIISKIGNGSEFKKGRELAAYLGLIPRQHSSGEKKVLGRITKRGDSYLRQLLVHGGRSYLLSATRRDKQTGDYVHRDLHAIWARKLKERLGMNKASVALANKHARIIIGLLKRDKEFDPKLAHCGISEK